MVLSVDKVEFSYGKANILKDINFKVKKGILFLYWALTGLVSPP